MRIFKFSWKPRQEKGQPESVRVELKSTRTERHVPPYNDEVVIRRTIFGLGQMERALRYSQEPTVKARAEYALSQLKNDRAMSILVACLKDSESGIRRGAAWALGMIGDAGAIEPLIEATLDPDPEVQACAAEALGNLGDSRCVGPLHLLLYHGDEAVRRTARKALHQIETRDQAMKQSVISQAQEILSLHRASDKHASVGAITSSVEDAQSAARPIVATHENARADNAQPTPGASSPVAIVIQPEQDVLQRAEEAGTRTHQPESVPLPTLEEFIPQIPAICSASKETSQPKPETPTEGPTSAQKAIVRAEDQQIASMYTQVMSLLSQPVLLHAPTTQQDMRALSTATQAPAPTHPTLKDTERKRENNRSRKSSKVAAPTISERKSPKPRRTNRRKMGEAQQGSSL